MTIHLLLFFPRDEFMVDIAEMRYLNGKHM